MDKKQAADLSSCPREFADDFDQDGFEWEDEWFYEVAGCFE